MVVYHYPGNMHNAGMLMVFLPKERILIEADSFTPASQSERAAAADSRISSTARRGRSPALDVDQVVPIHGRLTTLDEARKVIDSYRGMELFR